VINFWILALVNKEGRGDYVDVSIDVDIDDVDNNK